MTWVMIGNPDYASIELIQMDITAKRIADGLLLLKITETIQGMSFWILKENEWLPEIGQIDWE